MLYKNFSQLKNKKFSVVIIGSGPAGLSLALELEKKQIDSLVIDAGAEEFNNESQLNYKGVVNGNFPKDLSLLRYRKFGGTFPSYNNYLRKNFGIIRPLDKYDFKNWPINKSDLDPYLENACELLKIKNLFREKNLNDNLKLIEFGNSAVNFGKEYKNKIINSKFISLILNIQFEYFKGNSSVVEEIICQTSNLKKISIKSKIFILACGGIENSRLLLWTRNRSNLNLKNLPIGNYWMDHPFVKNLATIKSNNRQIQSLLQNDYVSHTGFLEWGNKTFSLAPKKNFIKKNKILNAGLFITIHKHNNYYPKDILKNLICNSYKLSKFIEKITKKRILSGATISASWEQDPLFENRISLDNKKDQFGIPISVLNYKKNAIIKKTILDCLDEIDLYLKNNNSGKVEINNKFNNYEDYLTDAGYHHLGGTRMGENINNSVIDSNMKVHNLSNLFIAGSSSFPSGGHANPTLTIIQLSLRLAEHLKFKYFI